MQDFESKTNPESNDGLDRVRVTADFAKSMAERAQSGVRELETQVDRQQRRSLVAVIGLILVAALAGAGAWWLNNELETQGVALAQTLGIDESVHALSARLDSAESLLSGIPQNWSSFTDRLNAVERRAPVRAPNPAPQNVAAPPPAPVNPAMDNRVSLLDERVMTLESQHEADIAKIESLHQELNTLRQDATRQVESVRAAIPRNTDAEIAQLQSAVDGNRTRIAALTSRMDLDRTDFEASRGPALEVIPGVLLAVKDLHVDRQQISGWIYLQNEHRFLWLKNHGLLQPITFYGVEDRRQRHIVLTRVTKKEAAGYVLTPKDSAGA